MDGATAASPGWPFIECGCQCEVPGGRLDSRVWAAVAARVQEHEWRRQEKVKRRLHAVRDVEAEARIEQAHQGLIELLAEAVVKGILEEAAREGDAASQLGASAPSERFCGGKSAGKKKPADPEEPADRRRHKRTRGPMD